MKTSLSLLIVSVGLLSACSSAHEEPLRVTGPQNANFQSDQAQCRAAAEQYDQNKPQEGALAGAAVGAVAGAIDNSDDLEGAFLGGLIGGGVGALEGREEMRKSHREMTIRCMQNKGHPVIG